MNFRRFSYKEGNFNIASDHYDDVCTGIITQRHRLEAYIRQVPEFRTSLEPLTNLQRKHGPASIPRIARIMLDASSKTGVGPMAAVAGAFAQTACETGLEAGDGTTAVENGGDIYITGTGEPVELLIGIYAPASPLSGRLAFCITADLLPLAVCSSSSVMGHSFSMGKCDLATVFSADAALADAAATLAGNMVHTEKDLETTAEHVAGIDGITGVFLLLGGKTAIAGTIPPLVQTGKGDLSTKVTRDIFSNLK